MNLGKRFAAACGFAALVALSAPASATTFTYDLTGDTNTAYTDPAWPGWTYIDLTDSVTGSGPHPGYTLSVGDTVQVSVMLNNPVTFTEFDIGLQGMADYSKIFFDPTYSYFSGGIPLVAPSSGDWGTVVGVAGGFGFGGGFSPATGTFSFDQVIVNAVITSMFDPSSNPVSFINLTDGRYPPYIGFTGANLATTPIPGALLLMMTALGGLGFVARRKRGAAA
ncbi:VPLPA-CTERM sorting domain-containing protein [Dongia sedimenti]|uniref:VPLPA-CTERM sorting domain-containing protein n=1 Tax=Dongia sedimenti TaxID=3064282 RepID=A0ABU0YUK3_9PROT|nr:VPLPA-CTERM sorting domain-containing protein [Rhodospirillaceae bacterium R-7]